MQNLLIGDRRPTGAGTISVTEPARAKPMAEVASAGPAELDQAVAAARQAFPDWSGKTAVARAEILFHFSAVVRAHVE